MDRDEEIDPVSADCPPDIARHTNGLSRRARSLRIQSESLRPMVADAYRRRASELELEAWALRVRRCPTEPVAA